MDNESIVSEKEFPDQIDEAGALQENVAEVAEQGALENLAADKDIASKTMDLVERYFDNFEASHDAYIEDVIKPADRMFRCDGDDAEREAQQTSDTYAKTGSTLFFRQVRTIAAQLMSILNSKVDPWRYEPIYSTGTYRKAEEGRTLAGQQNLLARWTRKADDWDRKTTELAWAVTKYSNVPILFGWNYERKILTVRKPIYGAPANPDEPPPVVGFDFSDEEVVTANHPTWKMWPVEDFYADPNIGDLQKQNCIILKSLENYCSLYDAQRSGDYINVDKLDASHLYQGDTETGLHAQKQSNMGATPADDTQTGLFKVWRAWVRLPIADGKWDSNNKPMWYIATFVGETIGSAVCVQIVRNYDTDDEFPGMMLHAIPDDDDLLYHLSLSQCLESNYNEQTTKKNQAIDNDTLKNRRPLKGIRGEVFTADLTYSQNKVLWVEKQDSLQEMDVANIAGDTLGMLGYIEDDSNRTAGTDKPMQGIAMGQRTSATEAQNVFDKAMMPHIAGAKYILADQFLPAVARKWIHYWERFSDPKQVIEITGEPQAVTIAPYYLYGDYDVVVDVLDQYETNQVKQQNLTWALQTVLPVMASDLDMRKFGAEILEIAGFKNPQTFFKDKSNLDAERIARIENQNILAGQYDEPQEGEDHETHHRIHESELFQYRGIEDRIPYIDLLKAHDEATVALMEAGRQALASPVAAAPMNQSVGEVSGNAIAGQLGAMQNPQSAPPPQ